MYYISIARTYTVVNVCHKLDSTNIVKNINAFLDDFAIFCNICHEILPGQGILYSIVEQQCQYRLY